MKTDAQFCKEIPQSSKSKGSPFNNRHMWCEPASLTSDTTLFGMGFKLNSCSELRGQMRRSIARDRALCRQLKQIESPLWNGQAWPHGIQSVLMPIVTRRRAERRDASHA